MKSRIAAAALAASLLPATLSLAGETTAATPANDFSGAYAGVSATGFDGSVTYRNRTWSFGHGVLGGGFVGYNMREGDFVFGAEASAHTGTATARGQDLSVDLILDLRTRAGYVFGDSLAYVAGGVSALSLSDRGFSETYPFVNIGAGVEVPLTDRVFVGADYTYRKAWFSMLGDEYTAGYHNVQARIGYRF